MGLNKQRQTTDGCVTNPRELQIDMDVQKVLSISLRYHKYPSLWVENFGEKYPMLLTLVSVQRKLIRVACLIHFAYVGYLMGYLIWLWAKRDLRFVLLHWLKFRVGTFNLTKYTFEWASLIYVPQSWILWVTPVVILRQERSSRSPTLGLPTWSFHKQIKLLEVCCSVRKPSSTSTVFVMCMHQSCTRE